MAERETSGSSTDDECEKPISEQEPHEIRISKEPLEDNEGNEMNTVESLPRPNASGIDTETIAPQDPIVGCVQVLGAALSAKPTDEKSSVVPFSENTKSQSNKRTKGKRKRKGKRKTSNSECHSTGPDIKTTNLNEFDSNESSSLEEIPIDKKAKISLADESNAQADVGEYPKLDMGKDPEPGENPYDKVESSEIQTDKTEDDIEDEQTMSVTSSSDISESKDRPDPKVNTPFLDNSDNSKESREEQDHVESSELDALKINQKTQSKSESSLEELDKRLLPSDEFSEKETAELKEVEKVVTSSDEGDKRDLIESKEGIHQLDSCESLEIENSPELETVQQTTVERDSSSRIAGGEQDRTESNLNIGQSDSFEPMKTEDKLEMTIEEKVSNSSEIIKKEGDGRKPECEFKDVSHRASPFDNIPQIVIEEPPASESCESSTKEANITQDAPQIENESIKASCMEPSGNEDCSESKMEEKFSTPVESFSEEVDNRHESTESEEKNNPGLNTDSPKNITLSGSTRPYTLEKQDSTASEPRSLRTLASCESLKTEEDATESSEHSAQATTSAESSGSGKKQNPDSSDTALGSVPTPSTSDSSGRAGRSSESGRGSYRTPAASGTSAETDPESREDSEVGRNPFEPVPQDCQNVAEEMEMQVIPPADDFEVENPPHPHGPPDDVFEVANLVHPYNPPVEVFEVVNPPHPHGPPAEVLQVENPPHPHGSAPTLHSDTTENERPANESFSGNWSGRILCSFICVIIATTVTILVLFIIWVIRLFSDPQKGKDEDPNPRRFYPLL